MDQPCAAGKSIPGSSKLMSITADPNDKLALVETINHISHSASRRTKLKPVFTFGIDMSLFVIYWT